MFTIRQFQHFAAVAKLGSFRKAAASLGLAQSTLSRSIQELEEVLAVRLFERDQRSVQITPEGRKSLELAENMLRKVDEVRARF